MTYLRHLRDLMRLVQSFGIRRGALAYSTFAAERLFPRTDARRLRAIELPGVSKPLWIRAGTSDWQVMTQIYVDREYDTSLWPVQDEALAVRYEAILRDGGVPVIVDCGANVGLSAAWYAEKFPRARIYAVEPEADNFAILSRNAALFGAIVPIRAAVSDHKTRMSLHNETDAPWAWATKEDAASGEVDTVTIPEILAREPGGALLIVKIDIEGSEAELFRSNLGWVEEASLVVLELHDWLFTWRGAGHAVFSSLTSHRRDYLQRGEKMFSFSFALADSARKRGPGVEERRAVP
jgi:FkbM family methyltransferase